MGKRQSKNMIIGILCCMLVFMGVGYAAIQQTLHIGGTGNITGSFDIYIKSIEIDTENTSTSNGNISLMQNSIDINVLNPTTATFSSILQKPGDYVTFEITVENRGTIDSVLSSYTRTATPNNTLSTYLNGASYNTYFTMSNPFDDDTKKEISSGSSVVYSVRVDFKEGATSIPEGSLQVEIELNYIQKNVATDTPNNGGGSGGNQGGNVETPLDFTLDSNGVIIDYDESQVIDNNGYLVVGATNSDGEQITGANSNSFIKSNVTIYTETDELSEDEITTYVVDDEENFNSIKSTIEGLQQTSSTRGIRLQRLGTSKVRIVRRSEYSGSGEGVKKYVNTSTGQITNPTMAVTKLDLSGASNITSISAGAFQEAGLTHLKLGNSLTTIGANAFKSNSITTITIPASVTTIGDGAFAQNSFADSSAITINKSASNAIDRFNERWTIIGFPGTGPEDTIEPTDVSCFTYTKNAVDGHNEITISGYSTATKCPKTVVIPSTITVDNEEIPVTTIANNAFRTKSLKSVYIPYTVETIQAGSSSAGAFTGNTATLESITFENTASHPSHLKTIGLNAFRGASASAKLSGNLVIPASVEEIGNYAFVFSKFTSLTIENTASRRSNLKTIGNYAFASSSGSSVVTGTIAGELKIPSKVTSIGQYAFKDQLLDALTIEDDSTINRSSQLTSIGITSFRNNKIRTLIIPASVTTIGGSTTSNGAFKGNLFESAEDITVKYDESKNILLTRFDSNWSKIGFPGTGAVKPLTDECFTFDSSTGTITGYDTTCPKKLVIPSTIGGITVTKIGNSAFKNKGLVSVTIPYTVTTIESGTSSGGAFSSNSSLTSVTFEDGNGHSSQLTTIGTYAFYNCKLANVTIPSSVTTIGNNAFKSNSFDNSSDITIGYNQQNLITRFDSNWYDIGFPDDKYGCFYVEYGDSSKITNYDSTCTKDVVIPNQINGTTVTLIKSYAFRSKQITSVSISDSVTEIGWNAFENNQLESVTIPSSVTTIGNFAFQNNRLKSVTILGNITEIKGYTFQGNLLQSIDIPSSVTTIGGYAFQGNQLESVTIPSSVTIIGFYAFAGNHISNLEFEGPSSLGTIDYGAFYWNDLASVTIPEGVTYLGASGTSSNDSYGAFAYNAIESISLPSTLMSVGSYSFYSNSLTGTAVIPSRVYEIGNNAFDLNTNLSTIVIKRNNSTGMTLGTDWNGSASIVYNPNYGE